LGGKTVLREIPASHDAKRGLGVSPVQKETATVVLELNSLQYAPILGSVRFEVQPFIKLWGTKTPGCMDHALVT